MTPVHSSSKNLQREYTRASKPPVCRIRAPVEILVAIVKTTVIVFRMGSLILLEILEIPVFFNGISGHQMDETNFLKMEMTTEEEFVVMAALTIQSRVEVLVIYENCRLLELTNFQWITKLAQSNGRVNF